MAQALRVVAEPFDPSRLAWAGLRYENTQAIRTKLPEHVRRPT
jgi:hypothetical protein